MSSVNLNKSERGAGKGGFTIEPAQLSKLFEPDNIREHESMKLVINKFHGIQGLLKSLKTTVKGGASNLPHDILERQQYYGRNDPPVRKSASIFTMIAECFEDLMLQVLVIASIVSTVIGIVEEGWATGWMEGAAIMVAIVLIVSVTAGNNYIKEKQFQKLNAKRAEMNVHVTRDDKIAYIDVKELLVGDILHMEIGDVLPIDGILVEGSEILMDESSVTGESDLISKVSIYYVGQGNLKAQPFLVSGSKVMDGNQ